MLYDILCKLWNHPFRISFKTPFRLVILRSSSSWDWQVQRGIGHAMGFAQAQLQKEFVTFAQVMSLVLWPHLNWYFGNLWEHPAHKLASSLPLWLRPGGMSAQIAKLERGLVNRLIHSTGGIHRHCDLSLVGNFLQAFGQTFYMSLTWVLGLT